MALHKKADPRFRYVDIVKDREAEGFSVRDVHYSIRTTANGHKRQVMQFEMDTPYTYAGEAVRAYAEVDPSLLGEKLGAITYDTGETKPGVRSYSGCELFMADSGSNLEDVSERENGTRAFVVMKGSEPLAGMKALDEIGQFAAAASNYPSVAREGEYRAMQALNYEKAKVSDIGVTPQPGDYLKYLEHQYRFAQDSHAKLVGRATSPEQIQALIEDYQKCHRNLIEEHLMKSGIEKDDGQMGE